MWFFFLFIPLFVSGAEDEALFLRRIAHLWQDGEYKMAKGQIEEFLGKYPENELADPLFTALGDLYLREKEYEKALETYTKIKTVSEQVFFHRMQCFYEMGWYSTLIEECKVKLPALQAKYFLAIAFYNQGNLEEAKPLFEELYASELSNEVAYGYARLCVGLKDYPKAAQIYLELSKGEDEEMLFQAALMQAEFDKAAAVKSFSRVASLHALRVKEATFNEMALLFDLGRFEEVVSINWADLPEEKWESAHLLLGRSLLELKRPKEAQQEFNAYSGPLTPELCFELICLDYEMKDWNKGNEDANRFILQFADHPLSGHVNRYKVTFLSELKLYPELAALLEKAGPSDLLAKTYYEMKEFEKALQLLKDSPNERLLAAFCYRDGQRDLARFVELAEQALLEGADVVDAKQVRFALFNAHLELMEKEKAAEHLYAAFVNGAELKEENLEWLGEVYYEKLLEEESPALAEKLIPLVTGERLSFVYMVLGRFEEAVALLEGREGFAAQLLRAEMAKRQGLKERAIELFDAVAESASLRSSEGANAALQSALLKGEPALLRKLTVQKNFAAEPAYLEAALEYVEAGKQTLAEMKQEFEAQEDLLSKDYHEARKKFPQKDRMYQGYMQLIDAMLLLSEDEPQKAKELLLQVSREQQASELVKRAKNQLAQIDEE